MSDVCPKCESGDPRLEPAYGNGARPFSCGSVFRDDEPLFLWGECDHREKELLRNQLAQANERLNTLLNQRMDEAEAKIGARPAHVVVEELQAENERLREALEAIQDYNPFARLEGEAEIVYDRYAYERMVESYRSAARKALEGGDRRE